jgi:hypothetical protein
MAVPWPVPIFRLVTKECLITYGGHHFSGEMLDDLQHLVHLSVL